MITAENLKLAYKAESVKKSRRKNNVPEITQRYLKYRLEYRDGLMYWRNAETMSDGWNTIHAGKKAGTISSNRETIRINGKHILTHRAIWMYHNGMLESNISVEHIGDPKDHRIENLKVNKP